MSVKKIEAWKDSYGVLHESESAAMIADARRAIFDFADASLDGRSLDCSELAEFLCADAVELSRLLSNLHAAWDHARKETNP